MRRAFTLIELMVVIGIIALIAALSFGGIFRMRTANRLLATEQVVADMIRQARHTARSSGSPVTLRLTRDRREIAGVSQVSLWYDHFDGTKGQTSGVIGNAPGLTGQGLSIPDLVGVPAAVVLEKYRQLKHGARAHDGFYIACAVYAPPAATGPAQIPLLMVGSPGGPRVDQSVCGLMLVRASRPEMHVVGRFLQTQGNPSTPVAADPTLDCWEIYGWIGNGKLIGASPGPIEVSSLTNAWVPPVGGDELARQAPAILHASVVSDIEPHDVPGPLVGDRWEDVGLSWDGASTLSLYRNGRRVASVNIPSTTALRDGDSIYIGSIADDVRTYVTPPNAILDNARLYRLTITQPGLLPTGVVADDDYTITCQPDGRVDGGKSQTVYVRDAGGGTTVTLATGPTRVRADARYGILFSLGPGATNGQLSSALVSFDAHGLVRSSYASRGTVAGSPLYVLETP